MIWQKVRRTAKELKEAPISSFTCQFCEYKAISLNPDDLGVVRGNTERFKDIKFRLWKCPKCGTILSLDPVEYHDIYTDYPLNRRRLDIYARGTLGNLLSRLKRAGLKKTDSILDYGCGNGVFIQFLRKKGYDNVVGYDPFVPEFSYLSGDLQFDCIVANDVIEHVDNPRHEIRNCVSKLKPGGLLYIGTADSNGVDMTNLEPHIMRLHQPYHRMIIAEDSLHLLGKESGLELVGTYKRSYMDTLIPFANYRFLDEFSRALGHNMDAMLDPSSGKIIVKKPVLLFFGFLGYFFPSASEPAVVLRKLK